MLYSGLKHVTFGGRWQLSHDTDLHDVSMCFTVELEDKLDELAHLILDVLYCNL